MRFKLWLVGLAVCIASAVVSAQPASAGGFGSETYPVPTKDQAVFVNGSLGGEGDLTLNGTPYAYDPADGNLVMEVIATNQANVCNGCGNGFMLADETGTQVVRAVFATGAGVFNGTGALVTVFNGALTIGSADSGNCYPFDCNDSGSSMGQSFDYYEVYNAAVFGGPISIAALSFPQWGPMPGTVLTGNYEVVLGVESDVPEPAGWALLLVGVGAIGGALRLARRKNETALYTA